MKDLPETERLSNVGPDSFGVRMPETPRSSSELYLDLLKRVLTRYNFASPYAEIRPWDTLWARLLQRLFQAPLQAWGLAIVRRTTVDPESRWEGRTPGPPECETQLSLRSLNNLQYCATEALKRGIRGDFIEAGVWRGGATILMAGVLEANGDRDRVVWVADSFRGVPRPDPTRYPADAGDTLFKDRILAVPMEEVQANFVKYNLMSDRIRLLPGWFRDSLPHAPIRELALIRLDGDLYESTYESLRWLYPKLTTGGYLIVDDYGCMQSCRQAVDDFRRQAGIREPLREVDWTGVYWRRER
jgi:O-methyltransferase